MISTNSNTIEQMNKALTVTSWSPSYLLSQAEKYQSIADWHRINGHKESEAKALECVATYQRLAKQHS